MPDHQLPPLRIVAARCRASDGLEGFKAHAVFQEINKKLQQVRRNGGFAARAVSQATKAGAELRLSRRPIFWPRFACAQAFFQGKLKITGNMGLAMKLQNLQLQPAKAKL
ncbi:non-specific lipid-transfer protein-like [Hippocampus comes]|uniref:non-specific lipid-transfer protein-like n=1 Tax=Hippocampus comes TaxID=109280 RepID=UPI00094F129F|nr:PREDICTED: non-specific lipid-transfer protein-like [Hippocampus comes]